MLMMLLFLAALSVAANVPIWRMLRSPMWAVEVPPSSPGTLHVPVVTTDWRGLV